MRRFITSSRLLGAEVNCRLAEVGHGARKMMTIAWAVLLLVAGLALIVAGGDWLVAAAVRMGRCCGCRGW